MSYIRLGVNIDHIATLRNARGGVEPDPVEAAYICVDAGADQITTHLREDRRHITDRDFTLLSEAKYFNMNLEMAATDEMVGIACKYKPHSATLVPEGRHERTTEGGLDVISNMADLKTKIKKLNDAGILVSLFIEPDKKQVEASKEAGAGAIEIHTGRYSLLKCANDAEAEYQRIVDASALSQKLGLFLHAGHGLNYFNTRRICEISGMRELNIGHSIISRAVFYGLYESVSKMKQLINNYSR
ncbi:MAG: pyridoxine 5'-phosphate synthase [Candidatus Wallbacteria bacterium]